tara:strand:+ start:264 stop:689 length:426 start_codon:yes stop_codon:yes gene_type:complete
MKNKFLLILGFSSILLVGCGTSTTKLSYGGNVKIKKDNISCQTYRDGFWRTTKCTAGGILTNNIGQRRSYRDSKICFKVPIKPGASNRPRQIMIWGPWPLNVDEPVCNAARKFNFIPNQTEELDKYNFEREAIREFNEDNR